jgi:phage terminase large subunit GpA-like protein
MAKRNSRQRIDPQLEDVPELRARVAPARSRDCHMDDIANPIVTCFGTTNLRTFHKYNALNRRRNG